jgi:hypothetical protein
MYIWVLYIIQSNQWLIEDRLAFALNMLCFLWRRNFILKCYLTNLRFRSLKLHMYINNTSWNVGKERNEILTLENGSERESRNFDFEHLMPRNNVEDGRKNLKHTSITSVLQWAEGPDSRSGYLILMKMSQKQQLYRKLEKPWRRIKHTEKMKDICVSENIWCFFTQKSVTETLRNRKSFVCGKTNISVSVKSQ